MFVLMTVFVAAGGCEAGAVELAGCVLGFLELATAALLDEAFLDEAAAMLDVLFIAEETAEEIACADEVSFSASLLSSVLITDVSVPSDVVLAIWCFAQPDKPVYKIQIAIAADSIDIIFLLIGTS